MVRAGEHGTRRCLRSWDFSLEKKGLRRDVIATGRTKSCLAEALGHKARLQSSPAGPGLLLGSWCAAEGSHTPPAWAGRHRRAVSSPAPPAPAAGQPAACQFLKKKPNVGRLPAPSLPSCAEPRSLCFSSHSHGRAEHPLGRALRCSGQGTAGLPRALERFKCSKGISRASLQISASPALSTGSGAALPGEKPCSWNSLHPRRTRRLAGMERGAGSCQQ